jgi:hypothetical protein
MQYRLVHSLKAVKEAFVGYKGTLGDKGRTVDIVGVTLEEAVPMLERKFVMIPGRMSVNRDLTIEVAKSKESFFS